MDVTVQETRKSHLPKNVIPFAEALDKTGFGVFNHVLIFIGGCVLANVILENGSISFINPVAECDLNLTNQDKGILSTIGYIGIIVSSHLWGFLADTKGRRAVIVPTLFISFLVTVLSSFSPKFWILVVFRFINGFFISAGSATTFAYVGEFHSDRTRSRAMLVSSFYFSLGSMILPFAAWIIINQDWSLPMQFLGIVYKPWRLFALVCGTPGILCALALLFYPESPKFLLSVGRDTEAIAALKQMHRWNCQSGELQIDGIIAEPDTIVRNVNGSFLQTIWKQTAPLFKGGFLKNTTIVCTIHFWMHVTSYGVYMWFPNIIDPVTNFMDHYPGNKSLICDAVHAKHASMYEEGGTIQCTDKLTDGTFMYSLIMEAIFSTIIVIIAIIVNRIRKAYILFVILVASGACGIISVHLENPSISLYIYILLFISADGVLVLNIFITQLYPTHLRAMALCISLMFGKLGGVLASNMIGILIDDNCELMIHIAGGALIASGCLSLLIRT